MAVRSFVQKIHDQALVVSKTFHQSQKDLIQIIQQMDDCKGYRDFGCPSLWVYCQTFLKLDENQTSTFILLARKSREVPELKLAIDSGQVAVSKARRIAPVITKENKSHWISLAQSLPKQQLEREIAKHSPQLATKQQAKYVSSERVQFQCGLDQKDFEEFLEIQNLVSQKTKKPADFEMTLRELVRFYKEANDPVKKAERAEIRRSKTEHGPGHVKASNHAPINRKRSYPAWLEHQINLRDQRQCTETAVDGKRCRERRWLEFHHIISVEKGGPDTIENMRTICWAHHKMIHKKLGVSDQIRPYRKSG